MPDFCRPIPGSIRVDVNLRDFRKRPLVRSYSLEN
jgi:hypothetical protein